jgi:predicted lactoylglutathione lyase
MLTLSCETRGEVDSMSDAAATSGGTADISPKRDLGFLYYRNLADPDGHVWEAMWMDMVAAAAAL